MKIQTKLHVEDICSVQSNSYAVLLAEGFGKHEYEHIAKIAGFDVHLYLENKKFTGAAGSLVALPVIHQEKVTELFFVGLGKKENNVLSFETYRRALGSLITNAQAKKLESLVFAMPAAEHFDVTANYLASQTHTIITIAGYKFDQFVTQGEKAPDMQVHVVSGNNDLELVQKGFAIGAVIGQAVNRERDWVNTPPSKLTPTHVADMAEKLAQEHGLQCTIFDGEKIAELGMEGLHGVSRGSGQDPRFVILEYKSKNPNAQTIGFVGKGITFDSGGLSIKPADSMEEMKEDMAGAGAVINAIVALAQLQPDVHVVACAALTENLVGPHSLKPGDILKFYNGKTAEVRNTDAEGRLVLADALSYITKNYQLSAVIDIATLTGACIYAVGPFFAALLSDNQNFADIVKAAGQRSGDYVWQLPFTPDFKTAVKSEIADIQNVGNRSIAAGTITAAWFLREFVENDTPWVHLDIASSAYNVPNISYFRPGSTGMSVRLLIDLAMHWKA